MSSLSNFHHWSFSAFGFHRCWEKNWRCQISSAQATWKRAWDLQGYVLEIYPTLLRPLLSCPDFLVCHFLFQLSLGLNGSYTCRRSPNNFIPNTITGLNGSLSWYVSFSAMILLAYVAVSGHIVWENHPYKRIWTSDIWSLRLMLLAKIHHKKKSLAYFARPLNHAYLAPCFLVHV